MEYQYKILHVEDSATDAELIEMELRESDILFDYLVVDTREEYVKALTDFKPDVILCDHTLPAFNSFEALRLLKLQKLNIPFIVITATMTEDVAVTIVRSGADDYILKDRLKRLPHVVLNAIDKYRYEKERKQLIDEAYEKEANTKELLIQLSNKLLLATKSAGIGIWDWNLKTGNLDWDDGMLRLYNITDSDFGSNYYSWLIRFHPEDKQRVYDEIEMAIHEGKPYDTEFRILWQDSSVHYIKANGTVQRDETGKAIRMLGVNQDITKSKESEKAIKDSEAKYRSFFESSLDGILLTSPDGGIFAANAAACQIYGMTEEELCRAGREGIVDVTDPRLHVTLDERRRTGQVKAEMTAIRKGGKQFPVEISSALFVDANGEERTSLIVRDITERKKAEQEIIIVNEALEQALSELRKIMDSSVDIICTIDDEGKFANVSSAAEKVWGYKPHELIGRKYFDLLFEEDRNITLQAANRLVRGVPFTMFENRFVRKDGSIVPLLWSGRWDKNDKLIYCVAKDATEKKRLEMALEKERQRFYKLFYQAPLMIGVLKGESHVYDFVNPFYSEFIGKHDIIGKPMGEVLPEVAEQGFIKILDDVYTTGKSFIADEVPMKLDKENNGTLVKSYVNIVYQAYTDGEDKIEGIFFFTIDVTEQVLSRKKIEKSEKRFRQIVETAQEGIWMVDENNNTTFVNKKLCEILGYTEAEMIGKTNFSFKAEDEQSDAKLQDERRKKRMNETYDCKYITKNGNVIYAQVSSNPVFAEDGTYTGSMAMLTDITDRKVAEIERIKLVNDLVMRNKDLEQFTYIVSHNLRAPVANIIGMTTMLSQGALSVDEKEYIHQGIYESVSKLDMVVKDLNHILQIKNAYHETKEKVYFSKLVDDIKRSIKHILTADVLIRYDFTKADHLFTVKSYLYSILYNLITNSIKYRRPHVYCIIDIKSFLVENRIEIIVSDNGMGIDLEQRGDEMFGLYKRFHTDIEGKGIGLFMVKMQTEALKGSISVCSEINKGTSFKIKFEI